MEEKEIEIEVVKEDTVHYSDEEIDEKVDLLIKAIKANNYQYSDDIYNQAKVIAKNSKDYLDDKTYYWVLYAYNLKYVKEENKNARIFIMMRIRNLIKMTAMKEEKRAKALTYTNFEMDEHVNAEVEEVCAFIGQTQKKMRMKFLLAQLALGLIFIGVVVLFFKAIPLIGAIGIAVLITLLNYFVSSKSINRMYIIEQTNCSKSYCKDQEIKDFDAPVMNS